MAAVTNVDDAETCMDALSLSPARPTLLDVLARLAENGFAAEVVRCVRLCRDAASNKELWERVVDVPRGVRLYTRLMHFAAAGDVAGVHAALARGASVGARGANEWTALHVACERGTLAAVSAILDAGAAVDARTALGDAPLHAAAREGHADVIEALAARSADVYARNKAGWMPLHAASAAGRAVAAAALLRASPTRAYANALCGAGLTALMWAASRGHIDVVRTLLASGLCDADAVCARGLTARQYGSGRRDIVAALESTSRVVP